MVFLNGRTKTGHPLGIALSKIFTYLETRDEEGKLFFKISLDDGDVVPIYPESRNEFYTLFGWTNFPPEAELVPAYVAENSDED